ncbi:response regulator transcription factor [Coralliovum pocilloporae]|uniref:response regulator transcription factor n=1 Tax=Coralliovum pocilloporae TaxID=3066369 RepID=UPI003307513D
MFENPIRLLIVDDHDLLRDGIRARLTDEASIAIVGEASDGFGAIELCRSLDPDVVLLDISMPGMNGLEAASEIRKTHPAIRILFLSIYDNEEYVQEALRIGANGFILKDVSKGEMILAIQAVARGCTYLGPSINAAQSAEPAPDTSECEDAYGLSGREREVLSGISRGFTNREIAEQLTISVRTVESHRLSIREKTGGGNAIALSKIAAKLGL